MKKIFIIFMVIFYINAKADDGKCSGTFVNPIIDVCWACMFPIYISPLPIKWGYLGQKGDIVTEKPSIKAALAKSVAPMVLPLGICGCPNPTTLYRIGMLMSFYEPYRSVDVTKDPFCMVGLGGINLAEGLSDLLPSPGYGDEVHGMQTRSSFYQIHWYLDPILEMLEILDIGCTMGVNASIDVMFMSEVDPAWSDDDTSFIFSPEVVLFTGLPATLACATDCIAASLPYIAPPVQFADNVLYTSQEANPTNTGSYLNPSRSLYWCGGCQGSLFPLNGNNIDNEHEVQTTVLTSYKANMLMHRMGLEMSTTGVTGMCANVIPDMFMDKT
ncbi:MAG: TraU family protein, partial [Burkholderiales bacterium]|nr:TraU family protein [Burkholderiales bacterium]